MSLFGFGTINGQLKERVSLYPEPVLTAARRNIELYKRYRHLLQHDCHQLLKPADKEGKGGWQAVEFASPTGQEAVVLAFRAESPQQTVQLTLRGLQADANYDVHFANGNRPDLKTTGGDLLSKGIGVSLEKRSHVGSGSDADELILFWLVLRRPSFQSLTKLSMIEARLPIERRLDSAAIPAICSEMESSLNTEDSLDQARTPCSFP